MSGFARFVGNGALGQVNHQFIAGLYFFDQALHRFAWHQIPTVDTVAEKNAGIKLGNDHTGAGLGNGQRGVLARTASAKILSADNNRKLALKLIGPHKRNVAGGQAGLSGGYAVHGVHAEELSLGGVRRVVGQKLGGNDLIGINVVAENKCLPSDDILHVILPLYKSL